MKKNVASQNCGCQMVNATTGAAFTSAVTVAVTVDAGVQATGATSAGACTHEGNGYHTYVPTQGETNGDLLAFTFTGSGAIPVTVQIYTTFPQTVDNATSIAAIKAKTDNLPASPANETTVAAVKTQTDKLAFGVTNQLDVNVESINTATVNGVGTSGDKWRGS